MATYKILFWQNIPSQIKAWDEWDEVNLPLGERFMTRIDKMAQEKGLTSSDEYMSQWKWGDEEMREGTAEDVARAIRNELEEQFR
jgi:hypothetical protein